MTKRIFRSTCLVAVAVFLASLVLIMGVLYSYFSSTQMRQLKTQAELAAKGVAAEGADFFDGLDTDSYRITWIDADGSILYDSQADASSMENHLEREEVQEALKTGAGDSTRYSTTLMERELYAARKLPDGTVLRLSGAQYTVLSLLLSTVQPIVMVAVTAVGLSLLLSFQLSRSIVKPLNEMDLDNPVVANGYEELTPMVSRLRSQQNQLRLQEKKLLLDVAEKEDAEQMRREFTANVSHELKTPLHTISGCAELLANGVVKSEDVPKFSQEIFTETKRMIALVEDIIGLSHLDEGAGDMKREDTDLYELAENTVESLLPAAKEADVTVNLKGESAPIHGIPQLLSGIIFNLCDNAIKYNKKGGSVDVSVETGERELRFRVRDTGIGIPPEQQGRIFERFYRVDKSHSKELGGTGLGLSIVKHAAKLHNARIELESVPDEGTSITVIFPRL